MIKKIVYVGIDVDEARYHGSALNKDTGELLSFRCRPTLRGLLIHLAKIRKQFPRHLIKVAYEASYVGISLQRDLAERGYHCVVVAPTSIPRQGGKAPQGEPLAPIGLRCTTRQGQPALTFAARLANVRQRLR